MYSRRSSREIVVRYLHATDNVDLGKLKANNSNENYNISIYPLGQITKQYSAGVSMYCSAGQSLFNT